MKTLSLLTTFAFASLCVMVGEVSAQQTIPGWGVAIDPAGDCNFAGGNGQLVITVPGTEKPHDLSTELNSDTAPRVLQMLGEGNFTLQVRVGGAFQPGQQSTQPTRTAYKGAGLVVFADRMNFVRIERATLHNRRGAFPYINFEIRVNGALQRIGQIKDFPIKPNGPTWLRLERRGNQMRGAVSQDGQNWTYGRTKGLTANAWNGSTIQGGVAAISTSLKEFAPIYSGFSVKSSANTKR